jgi:acyl-CoA synthetase (AMP-forming)/AMP-acid ligase II
MLGETTPRLLQLAVSAAPDRVAATLEDREVTYLQCARAAARLAHALAGWGVRKGDLVLYWADISLQTLDVFFATAHLGAVFVPVNPAFSRAEVEAVLAYVQPQFVVVDRAHQAEAVDAARDAGAKFGVLDAEGASVAGFDLGKAAASASDIAPAGGPDGADPNVMFLTSGSTGRPKAVVISHRAHWLRTAAAPSYETACGGRGVACMFPLYHMAGWHMVLQAFGRRRPVHLVRQASAEALWGVFERHQPQEFYGIPAVWRRILEKADGRDGGCLTQAFTGTSRVEPDLVEAIRARFPNARTGIFYGSTEMGVSLGIAHEDIEAHPYKVGMPMPGVEARLDEGELLLRSDTAFDAYFRMPEETAEALQDGWYHSGDLVTVDGDGFFEIVGRRKEMIRSGGEWVSPAEVEAAIADIPGVQEVAVIGVPDESWGELVCAVLVVAPGAEGPSVEAVRAHLNGRLTAYKHPRVVTSRSESLPRTTATGQIQRSRIRQDVLAERARPAR